MSYLKFTRAFDAAGITMPTVRQHITRNIHASVDPLVLNTMTKKQIAELIKASNKSWHDGKSCAGAQIEDDCLWIGGDLQKLIPLTVLGKLERTETWVDAKNNHFGKVFSGSYAGSMPHPFQRGSLDTREFLREKQVTWSLGATNKVVD